MSGPKEPVAGSRWLQINDTKIPLRPEHLPALYEAKIVYDCGGPHDLHLDPAKAHDVSAIEKLALAIGCGVAFDIASRYPLGTPWSAASDRASPRRRCWLRLDLQADSKENIGRELAHLRTIFAIGEETSQSCSGGPSAGWMYEYSEDVTITHESYFAAVDKYLAELKELRESDVASDTSGQAGALS